MQRKRAIVIDKDGFIRPSQISEGLAHITVADEKRHRIDGKGEDAVLVEYTEKDAPQGYVMQEGDSLVFDDIDTAMALSFLWTKVRHDGKKWIGEGEPILQPEMQEPFDTVEDLLFRIAMLEIVQGQLRASEESLQMLTSGHLNEIQMAVQANGATVSDERALKLLDSGVAAATKL